MTRYANINLWSAVKIRYGCTSTVCRAWLDVNLSTTDIHRWSIHDRQYVGWSSFGPAGQCVACVNRRLVCGTGMDENGIKYPIRIAIHNIQSKFQSCLVVWPTQSRDITWATFHPNMSVIRKTRFVALNCSFYGPRSVDRWHIFAETCSLTWSLTYPDVVAWNRKLFLSQHRITWPAADVPSIQRLVSCLPIATKR